MREHRVLQRSLSVPTYILFQAQDEDERGSGSAEKSEREDPVLSTCILFQAQDENERGSGSAEKFEREDPVLPT